MANISEVDVPEEPDTPPVSTVRLTKGLVRKYGGLPGESFASIRELKFHLPKSSGKIAKIESLNHLVKLEVLDLGYHAIEVLENVGHLTNLRELNLSENKIHDINMTCLETLRNLENLNLSGNKIQRVPQDIGKLVNLRVLRLARNEIAEMNEIRPLASIPVLLSLTVMGNPFTDIPHHREYIVFKVNTLEVLDGTTITSEHRRCAVERFERTEIENLSHELDLSREKASMEERRVEHLKSSNQHLQAKLNHLVLHGNETEGILDEDDLVASLRVLKAQVLSFKEEVDASKKQELREMLMLRLAVLQQSKNASPKLLRTLRTIHASLKAINNNVEEEETQTESEIILLRECLTSEEVKVKNLTARVEFLSSKLSQSLSRQAGMERLITKILESLTKEQEIHSLVDDAEIGSVVSEWNTRLRDRKEELSIVQERVSKLREEERKLQAKFSETIEELEKAEARAQKIIETSREYSAKVSHLSKVKEQLEHEKSLCEHQLNALEREEANTQSRLKRTQETYSVLSSDVRRATQELEDRRTALKVVLSKHNDLETELRVVQADVLAATSECKDSQDRCSKYKAELSQVSLEIQMRKEELGELTAMVEAGKDKLHALHIEVINKSKVKEKEARNMVRCRHELSKLEPQALELKQELSKLNEQRVGLLRSIESERAELGKLSEERDDMVQSVKRVKREFKAYHEGDMEKIKQEIDGLEQRKKKLETEVSGTLKGLEMKKMYQSGLKYLQVAFVQKERRLKQEMLILQEQMREENQFHSKLVSGLNVALLGKGNKQLVEIALDIRENAQQMARLKQEFEIGRRKEAEKDAQIVFLSKQIEILNKQGAKQCDES